MKYMKIILIITLITAVLTMLLYLLFPLLNLTFYILFAAILYIVLSVFSWFIYFLKQGANKDLPRSTPFYSREDNNPVLFATQSAFPFDLFPDTVIVQEKTISIVRKYFFFVGWAETIEIKDIQSVRIYAGPFFGTIVIVKGVQNPQSYQLRTLWKKDAMRIKETLDGIILKEKNVVKIPDKITGTAKKDVIFEMGRTREVEKAL